MEQLRNKKGFICDMDGVIYHGNKILPGVTKFVNWLYSENKNFVFLTNGKQIPLARNLSAGFKKSMIRFMEGRA